MNNVERKWINAMPMDNCECKGLTLYTKVYLLMYVDVMEY